jgi:hypothetical protein
VAKKFPIWECLRGSECLDVNNPFKGYFLAPPKSVVDFETRRRWPNERHRESKFFWLTGSASRRPDLYVFESRGVYKRRL